MHIAHLLNAWYKYMYVASVPIKQILASERHIQGSKETYSSPSFSSVISSTIFCGSSKPPFFCIKRDGFSVTLIQGCNQDILCVYICGWMGGGGWCMWAVNVQNSRGGGMLPGKIIFRKL